MSDTPTPEVHPVPQTRKAFHEELRERAQLFAGAALNDLPEVESLAVVFSYTINSNDLPYAVVMGQAGGLRNPSEIVHMCSQLWRTLNFQLQNGAQCIKQIDELMAERAKELQRIQEQIDAAQRELAGIEARRDQCRQQVSGGDTARTAGPGAESNQRP